MRSKWLGVTLIGRNNPTPTPPTLACAAPCPCGAPLAGLAGLCRSPPPLPHSSLVSSSPRFVCVGPHSPSPPVPVDALPPLVSPRRCRDVAGRGRNGGTAGGGEWGGAWWWWPPSSCTWSWWWRHAPRRRRRGGRRKEGGGSKEEEGRRRRR